MPHLLSLPLQASLSEFRDYTAPSATFAQLMRDVPNNMIKKGQVPCSQLELEVRARLGGAAARWARRAPPLKESEGG